MTFDVRLWPKADSTPHLSSVRGVLSSPEEIADWRRLLADYREADPVSDWRIEQRDASGCWTEIDATVVDARETPRELLANVVECVAHDPSLLGQCGICGMDGDDDRHAGQPHGFEDNGYATQLREAAEALRKVCRTCAHFRTVRPGAAGCWAVRNGGLFAAVPADGSGGCWHNYEERAPVAAQEGRQ